MESGRECALHSSYLLAEELQEYLKTQKHAKENEEGEKKFANTNCK